MTRRSTSLPSDSALLEVIQNAFNTTFDDDDIITKKLGTQDIHTTASQIKQLRLKHGWRRRAANTEQLKAHRTETFTRVEALLKEGSIRQSKREFI